MGITRLKDLADGLADVLVTENIRHINAKTKNLGQKEARYVASIVIAKMIAVIVYQTLMEPPKLNSTPEQHEEYISKGAGELKGMLQDAISAGYSQAMTAFSGQPVDYYTKINVVPEPLTNTVQ